MQQNSASNKDCKNGLGVYGVRNSHLHCCVADMTLNCFFFGNFSNKLIYRIGWQSLVYIEKCSSFYNGPAHP